MAYNDGKLNAIVLNPRGQLDTANPPTDREPGTLVAAEDCHSTYLGPREGAKIGDGLALGGMTNTPLVFNGTTTYGIAQLPVTLDVPIDWTVDWWGKPTLTVSTGLPIFYLYGTIGILRVDIDADHNIQVTFRGSSSRGVAAGAGNSGTANSSNTLTTATKVHVRIVKRGSTLTIYQNGLSVYTVTNANLNYPIESAQNTTGFIAYVGHDAVTGFYKGVMYGLLLRSGAYDTVPFDQSMPVTIGSNFMLYYLFRGQNNPVYWDAGYYGAHLQVNGTTSTTSTVTDVPCLNAIQGMGSFVTRDGKVISVVVNDGYILSRYVS